MFQLNVAVEKAETEIQQSPPAVGAAIGGEAERDSMQGQGEENDPFSISTNDGRRGWGAKYAALFGDLRGAKERAKPGR